MSDYYQTSEGTIRVRQKNGVTESVELISHQFNKLMIERKFKLNDRVKVIKNRTSAFIQIGRTGTIVNMTAHPNPLWAVHFDDETELEEGIGYLMNESELELIE